MATEATYTPTWKCDQGVITRNGTTWTAKWNVPGSALKQSNKMFTRLQIEWKLDPSGASVTTYQDVINSGSASSYSIELNAFTGNNKNWGSFNKKKLSRKAFHPYVDGRVIQGISFRVRGIHDVPKDKRDGKYIHGKFAGKHYFGPWTGWCKWTPAHPAEPVVTLTYSNGSVTTRVKSASDNSGKREWAWTSVFVRAKKSSQKKWTYIRDGATLKETDKTYTDNIRASFLADLEAGKTVQVQARATAKGFGGNAYADGGTPDGTNPKAKWQKVTIGIPARAVIKSVERSGTKISVNLKSVGTPVHRIELQRRHGATGNWESVAGAVDDQKAAKATALYDTWGAVWPNGQVAGEYVYYRIKSTCFEYENFSAAFRADVLFKAKPKVTCGATCSLVAKSYSHDADTLTVTAKWTDSNVANTGTELSWSTLQTAWGNSTEQPETEEFPDSAKSKTVDYNIENLSPATTYYVRIRRYREVDGETYYSAYSPIVAFSTAGTELCKFFGSTAYDNGTTAQVIVGVVKSTEATGTEVSWSDYSGAWRSNKAPNTLDATWNDGTDPAHPTWDRRVVYLADLEPNTTYYVKARNYIDGTGGRVYSSYASLTLKTKDPSRSSALRCGLVSLTDDGDGSSATAVIGFEGDRTGCEVSWSEDPDAWESTTPPSTFEFTSADSASKSQSWGRTCTVHIHDLDQGATYYVRARSYYEDADGNRTWSAYTAHMSVTPFASPDEVTASAPEFVRRGEPIDVYWTVSGDLEQKAWGIMAEGAAGAALANGTGALCHGVIDPAAYGDAASISFHVEASVGGGFTASAPVTVAIADVPTLETAVPATLTAQPASFEAYAQVEGITLLATLKSDGVTVAEPDGDRDQLEGEVMWTSSVSPTWATSTWGVTALRAQLSSAASDAQDVLADAQAAEAEAQDALDGLQPGDEGYDDAYAALQDATAATANAATALADAQAALDAHPSDGAVLVATVELPAGIDLADGAGYIVSAKAVEPVGGLASEAVEERFAVAWAHQAPVPSDGIAVEVDRDARTATIALVPPSGAAEGDSYELYRKTQTGYDLIASGLPLSCTVTDRYAPFGGEDDVDYIVACRTADGDIDYQTYPYSLPVKMLRFDWPGGSVELPWNIELSDAYEKSFEARAHLDGSVNGYFERAVSRTGSYSTDVGRVDGIEAIRSVMALGEHAGAVFCRTQFGAAFQCNADVRSLETSYATKSVPASIAVTAMNLSDLYMVADGDVEVPQNG